jgi:hypothetical protein
MFWAVAFAKLWFYALGMKVKHDGCFHLARVGESA